MFTFETDLKNPCILVVEKFDSIAHWNVFVALEFFAGN